jgi:hypothetical protein
MYFLFIRLILFFGCVYKYIENNIVKKHIHLYIYIFYNLKYTKVSNGYDY